MLAYIPRRLKIKRSASFRQQTRDKSAFHVNRERDKASISARMIKRIKGYWEILYQALSGSSCKHMPAYNSDQI
jgi:hypothetical protein